MKQDLSKIKKLYTDNLQEHGATPPSVGWPQEDSQELRFLKLLDGIPTTEEVSINDLGVGYGAMLEYMIAQGFHISAFNGYDISEEMIEAATQKFPEQGNFQVSDEITVMADYSITSGIFNVRFDTQDADWESYIESMLRNMDAFSTKGFAFNLLSTYVDYQEDKLYYGDPKKWFDFCKTNFSQKVSLLHDYPLYEWTILVRK